MKNKVRLHILTLIFSLFGLHSYAQNDLDKADDLGRIAINAYISPQIENLPPSAKGILFNKLNQITSKNGVSGSALVPRFIISPNIDVITKDIVASAHPMTALTLEVTFYVGDGIEGNLFSSESIEIKGVGASESKAYISALKRINPSNNSIQNFLTQAKNKIIAYYNSQCDFILKEAQALQARNEYEAAIFKLTSIPEVCKDCYDKGMEAVTSIFQEKIDNECEQKLAEAENIWNSSQDVYAAQIAIDFLTGIDPNAACFDSAKELSKTISNRIKDLDEREWNLLLKEQQETVNNEKARIEAARDVGAAYGNNQPQNINYNTMDWWRSNSTLRPED